MFSSDFLDCLQREHDLEWPNVLCNWDPGVYVFAADPYVKVGWASNVWVRAEQLARGQGKEHLRPVELPRKTGGQLIAAWPGTRADERAAHAELADYRVIGEWFHHVPEVDGWIERKVAAARAEADLAEFLDRARSADPWKRSNQSRGRRRTP